MPNVHSTLTSLFSDIADAIRAKTGENGTIVADEFPDAIAAIPSGGGAKPSYLLSNGDTVSTFYFNGEYDLDTFLAGLTYADTDPNTGLGVCAIGLGYLYAVDMTNGGLTGEYALVENDGTNTTVIYTTCAVPLYGITEPGWQVLSYTPSTAVTVNMSSVLASFAAIIDSVVAKDDIAFGEHGGGDQPQLNAPSISISQMTLTITNPATNGNFVTGYKILVDGVKTFTTANTTYDLSGITGNTASVTVKACGTNFEDSNASAAASFVRYFSVAFYDGASQMTGSPVSATYNSTVVAAVTAGGVSTDKSGYDFNGWYSDSQLTTAVADTTAITSDLTLYGKWTEARYISKKTSVTIDDSGANCNIGYISPNGRYLTYIKSNGWICVRDLETASYSVVASAYPPYPSGLTSNKPQRPVWIDDSTIIVASFRTVSVYSFTGTSMSKTVQFDVGSSTTVAAVQISNVNASGKVAIADSTTKTLYILDTTTLPTVTLSSGYTLNSSVNMSTPYEIFLLDSGDAVSVSKVASDATYSFIFAPSYDTYTNKTGVGTTVNQLAFTRGISNGIFYCSGSKTVSGSAQGAYRERSTSNGSVTDLRSLTQSNYSGLRWGVKNIDGYYMLSSNAKVTVFDDSGNQVYETSDIHTAFSKTSFFVLSPKGNKLLFSAAGSADVYPYDLKPVTTA